MLITSGEWKIDTKYMPSIPLLTNNIVQTLFGVFQDFQDFQDFIS